MVECHICASNYCSKCNECNEFICDGCIVRHFVKTGHRDVITRVALAE